MNTNRIFTQKNLLYGLAAVVLVALVIIGFSKRGGSKEADRPAEGATEVDLTALEARPYVPPVAIEGTTFRLASINNVPVATSTNYNISFKGDTLSAKFCNGMSGKFALANGIISTTLVSTQMFCTEPVDVMTVESRFGKVLAAPASFYVEGKTLTIRGSNGEKFAFEAVE